MEGSSSSSILGFAHKRAANGQHLLLTAGKRSGNLPAALLQTRQALNTIS